VDARGCNVQRHVAPELLLGAWFAAWFAASQEGCKRRRDGGDSICNAWVTE